VLKDFRAFILRGNVVDLAVGVIIGAAFGAVVTALVKDIITPIVSIPGTTNFSQLHFTVRHSIFAYGDFLNALVAFLVIAAAVFFLVVVPVNHLMAQRKTGTEEESVTRDCPECLSSIPRAARRCAFCTAEVTPAA
jgi:large conductance mechanosensitive channel